MTSTAYLAEIGSCQMEYKYLSHLTGRKDFFNAVGVEHSISIPFLISNRPKELWMS